MDKRYFSDKIVKWYLSNKRGLPWRQTKDPYKIWLSEVILQQTRVKQGLPYYLDFVKHYPTVSALAEAPEQEVLRRWQGLGYYTRARNLRSCAQVVREKFSGRFPESFEQLLSLPGIGEYTAAAVASIAFGENVAVVDGNVHRVLSRLYGLAAPINTPAGRKAFANLATELLPAGNAAAHNQALMEFGALQCTPKNPACTACVFNDSCFAFRSNMQADLPVKAKKKPARRRYFYYLVFQRDNSLLMRKRVEKDIWFGMYDFQLIEKTRQYNAQRVADENRVKGDVLHISKQYKHVLTHQTIFSKFIVIDAGRRNPAGDKNAAFYSFSRISGLPKPVLVSRFLNDHYLL